MTTPLIEAIARAIVPAMLETSESYSDVPPEHIWTRPRYQWLAEASRRHAQAALTAITEAGMVIAPVEPTEAMQWAGWRAKGAIFSSDAEPFIAPSACYSAMIQAAQAGEPAA